MIHSLTSSVPLPVNPKFILNILTYLAQPAAGLKKTSRQILSKFVFNPTPKVVSPYDKNSRTLGLTNFRTFGFSGLGHSAFQTPISNSKTDFDRMSLGRSYSRTLGLRNLGTLGLSDPRTLGLSDSRTFEFSDSRTFRFSYSRILGLSASRTLGLSDSRTLGLSNSRTLGLGSSDSRPLGLWDFRILGL